MFCWELRLSIFDEGMLGLVDGFIIMYILPLHKVDNNISFDTSSLKLANWPNLRRI
jgi:hypothetical protein